MKNRFSFILVILSVALQSYGQGEKLSGKLYTNAAIQTYLKKHPDFNFLRDGERFSQSGNLRAGSIDTIDLPFIDDFSNNGPYPDRTKWANAYVYVNNHFALNPPSIGYASFDNLDWKGQPYQPINVLIKGASDSLTSQYIKVPFDTATWLSFFVEPKGLDLDPLDSWDSLSLYFYGKDSIWRSVWSINGKGLPDKFKQYFIKLDPKLYAHDGFRFMFVNFAAQTGNSNHWHLDYIELNVKRSLRDSIVNDLAICDVQTSLLKDYFQLPWKQLKAMPASPNPFIDTVRIIVNNLKDSAKNITYEFNYLDAKNVSIWKRSNSNTNVKPRTTTTFEFASSQVVANQTPVNDSLIVYADWTYQNPGDVNNTNNRYRHQQVFANYIAQDDGTAEGGYGVENTKIGKVANKFTLFAADSLWAIGMFFNQSYKDVRDLPFNIVIWRSITTGTNQDVVIKTIPVKGAPYIETYNGFAHFILDTAIFLPAGDYYIGWTQTSDFMLNVGVDMNYAVKNNYKPNLGVYYNVQKKWIQTFTNSGALMIRPYLGKKFDSIPTPLAVRESAEPTLPEPSIYPNPTNSIVYIDGNNTYSIQLFDLTGRILLQQQHVRSFDISEFPAGTYMLLINTGNGSDRPIYRKLVKSE